VAEYRLHPLIHTIGSEKTLPHLDAGQKGAKWELKYDIRYLKTKKAAEKITPKWRKGEI